VSGTGTQIPVPLGKQFFGIRGNKTDVVSFEELGYVRTEEGIA